MSQRCLSKGWSDMFYSHCRKHIPECVLTFTYNRISREKTRKCEAVFFRGKAHCKGQFCQSEYTFVIKKEPEAFPVHVEVTVRGKIHHQSDDINKRQVKGKKRSEVSAEASRKGAMKYYYEELAETPEAALNGGNMTDPQNMEVLRKIISESIQREVYHKDFIQDLQILKDTMLDDDETGSEDIKGFLQLISADPFTIICYSVRQIKELQNYCANNGPLYLDATGSIVGKISNQKRPLMYSLVGKIGDLPPVSFADMLTCCHTVPSISHFLNVLIHSASKINRQLLFPVRIETDWSWAIIQSALMAFDFTNVKQYLKTSWRILQNECSDEFVSRFTVVHICAAHMIKSYGRTVNECIGKKQKKLRKFLMHSFAVLQNTTSISEAGAIVGKLALILSSANETPRVKKALKHMEKRFNKISDTDEKESDIPKRPIVLEDEPLLDGTIRESSPYAQFFNDIVETSSASNQTSDVANTFYDTAVLGILQTKYLPIFPFWSGILLNLRAGGDDEKRTRDTNSNVESWFKCFKKGHMSGGLRVKPSKFVSVLWKGIRRRLKEIRYPGIRKGKSPPKKRKRKSLYYKDDGNGEDDIDLNLSQESWNRPTMRKKPAYQPSNKVKRKKAGDDIPVKNKRIRRENTEHTSSEGRSSAMYSLPTWGSNTGSQSLANTCTIDNGLSILFVAHQESRTFQNALVQSDFPVCKTLAQCMQLMARCDHDKARRKWLTTVNKGNNAYGSEWDFFQQPIEAVLSSELVSTCDNPECPKRDIHSRHVGIFLSASSRSGKDDLQDLLNVWSGESKGKCGRKYADNSKPTKYFLADVTTIEGKKKMTRMRKYCSGTRLTLRVLDGTPPIVSLAVADLVKNHVLPTDILSYRRDIRIAGHAYKLAGATFHKPGHFVSVIFSKVFGKLFYDDLRSGPQLLKKEHLNGCSIQFLVFVINE